MKLKPHHVAIGVGAVMALLFGGSGVSATLAQWHDDSAVQREVFGNIPSMWKAVFYIVVPTLVLYGPEDRVVPPSFPHRMTAACLEPTGPLVVPGAGHFLMWEAADTFNRITAAFCRP